MYSLKFKHIEKQISFVVNRPIYGLLAIILACFFIYFPVFSHQLMTGWDDEWQVVNYLTESGFTKNNLVQLFTETYYTQYSPINHFLYIIIYAINEYEPFLYHLANWILHVANIVLVYILLKNILRATTQLLPDFIQWITFLTTLLFAIHPLQVESVAWVSASKVLTCTFFYLLATCTFIHFLQDVKYRLANYVLTILFFLCAYGCKEQAVIFPVWATLLSLFFGRSLRSVTTWRTVLPFYIIAFFLGAWFVYGISSFAHVSSIADVSYSWWQRLIFSCYAFAEYICKWYAPYQLSHIYFYPMERGEALPAWMIFYPILLLVATWGLWSRLRHWTVLAGGAFFLVHILLVLHIIPVNRPCIVADRYIYLGSVGLSFIAAYFLVIYYPKWKTRYRKIASFLVFCVFLSLGFYSYQRVKLWRDTDTLNGELKELVHDAETAKQE